MSVRQQLSRHPLLGLFLVTLLLLGFVGGIVFLHFAGKQQAQQAAEYGQAMADRAASQAVEPALAQDMISLQVILQSLAQQPHVRGATVHDVENRLLVQSGDGDAPAGYRTLSFTAPITLDTHIAGHLSLTLAVPPVHRLYASALWLWAFAVAVCMAAFALLYQRLGQPSSIAQRALGADPSWEEPAEEDDEEQSEAAESVTIELRFLNLEALDQQLSRASFEERLGDFDQHLHGILALYTGTRQSFDDNRLLLTVTGDSLANASFYAICISELARALCRTGESPRLKVAARITPAGGDCPATLLEAYQAPTSERPPAAEHSATWISPELQSEELMTHIDVNADNYVTAIKPPYCSLLEKQQAQLAAL